MYDSWLSYTEEGRAYLGYKGNCEAGSGFNYCVMARALRLGNSLEVARAAGTSVCAQDSNMCDAGAVHEDELTQALLTFAITAGASAGGKLALRRATSLTARLFASTSDDAAAAVADDVAGLADDFIEAAGGNVATSSAARAADDVLALPRGGANLSQQRLDHIVERHWFGSQTANAGHFAQGTTGRGLTGMIDDAVRNGSFRPNTGGRPGTIFEYDFGSSIGTNIGGNATSRLRVVVDPNGNVITAFPF
jgi:hypothetical protein